MRLPVTTRKNAIVIPQRAVQELQGTYNVFVVGSDSVAQIRAIKPANRVGSDWVISEGLEPADRIVVEGLQKVRDGVEGTSHRRQGPGARLHRRSVIHG